MISPTMQTEMLFTPPDSHTIYRHMYAMYAMYAVTKFPAAGYDLK